jgi:DNA-binding transcriptional ArsR family regulator
LIDRIRHDIQDRLDQLLGEADKLRRALVALGSRDSGAASTPSPSPKPKPAPAKAPARSRSARPAVKAAIKQPETPAVKSGSAATAKATPATPARSASGATKNAVLAALGKGDAMTAGDVAAATGLGRATVSTTLSKLTKTGDVTKAERGYRLTGPDSTGPATPAAKPEAAKSDQSDGPA